MIWFSFVVALPIITVAAGFYYGSGSHRKIGDEHPTMAQLNIRVQKQSSGLRVELEPRPSPRALSWNGRQDSGDAKKTSAAASAVLTRHSSWHASPTDHYQNTFANSSLESFGVRPDSRGDAGELPEVFTIMPGHSHLHRRGHCQSGSSDAEMDAFGKGAEKWTDQPDRRWASSSSASMHSAAADGIPRTARCRDLQSGTTEFPELRVTAQSSGIGKSLVRRRSLRQSNERNGFEDLATQVASGSVKHLPRSSNTEIQEEEHKDFNVLNGGAARGEHVATLLPSNFQEEVSRISQSLFATTSGTGPSTQHQPQISIQIQDEPGRFNVRDANNSILEAEAGPKSNLKLCYFATGIAGSGIIGIYSNYLQNPKGIIRDHFLNTSTLLMLASFISGASLILLTLPCSSFIRVSSRTIQILKCTTLGYLTLAVVDICFMLLNFYALLAVLLSFVPAVIVSMCSRFNPALQRRLCWNSFGTGVLPTFLRRRLP